MSKISQKIVIRRRTRKGGPGMEKCRVCGGTGYQKTPKKKK